MGATLIALTVGYATESSAYGIVRTGHVQAVRSGKPTEIDRTTLQRAIEATPLRQSLVNIAMSAGRPPGSIPDRRWIAVLRRMGWRDTPSLQNILLALSRGTDERAMMDTLDALLRRGQLFTQTAGVMNAMEGIAGARPEVIRLLARHPSWRHDYLVTAGEIRSEPLALGRFQVLNQLQRRGDHMTRDEVAPLLPVLIRYGRPVEAWKLWYGFAGPIASPLQDGDFRLAANRANVDQISVPFEWDFPIGSGFSVDLYLEGGRPNLAITWDGRGVPVFATQTTSANRGRYSLSVATSDAPAMVADLLVFRLRCGDQSVDFSWDGRRRPGELRFGAINVPCDFPVLEMAGKLQGTSSAHSFSLRRITLSHLSGTPQ
ncbi:hypothetical protein [uncultured Sphingomonas sp.]|uniref:hypothetical protein n=1 Tax=uncultured Sphingomonas sp. TaxID=158754 RepID=UPI0035C9F73E